MEPFGRGCGSFDSGANGICAVMLAQLAGLYFSSVRTALWFIIEMTSQAFL